MKTVLVVFTTGFVPYGGLTTVMMNYYRAMDKSFVHIDFACTNDAPVELLEEIAANCSNYFRLPSRRKHLVSYFNSLVKLSKGYDVFHVHGNSSTSIIELLAAKFAGVKRRLCHNHNSVCEHKLLNAIAHPLFKCLYTDAIACSEKAGNWLFGKNKFIVLRNSIDVFRFKFASSSRLAIRSELNIDEKEFVIGHVGKFNKAKNHFFIVDVFLQFHKIYPSSKLLLVGGGSLEDDIRSYINKSDLADNVIITGLRTDIPELLCAMDLFLFPSLWEGLPLSVLEAQASGLPVFISENVTSEVKISDNCISLPLEKGDAFWANELLNHMSYHRDNSSDKNIDSLTLAGYNINTEADNLLKIYLNSERR